MADLNLKAVITAQDKASGTIGKVGGAFKSFAKIGIAGAVAGVGALTVGLVSCVKAAMDNQKVVAQTNAVLKSTKGIAGVTAQQVEELATEFQNLTGISDEEIRSGENMLLTFTKIGKDVFPTATETMLDMSVALGQDMKSSAIQLGKALQDPILGVTALRRVGVNFGEAEKKMIEQMVKAGDTMKAQKFILKELNNEFGNSSRAVGETFAGKLNILKQNIADLKETIGYAIIEAIQPFVQQLVEWAQEDKTKERINEIAKAMGNWISGSLPKAVNYMFKLFNIFKKFGEYLKTDWGKMTVAAIGIFVTALAAASGSVAFIVGLIIGTIWLIYRAVKEVVGLYKDKFNEMVSKLRLFKIEVKRAGNVFNWAIQQMINKVVNLINTIITLYNWIKNIILKSREMSESMSNALSGSVKGNWQRFKDFLGFQSGGIMPYNGMAYLHKGERITPSEFVANKDQSVTVNFYGNINNTTNAELDDIGKRISRSISLAKQGAI